MEIWTMKLYVGNLSYDTTDESLREAFEAVGPVASADVITDRYSGRSRGFGFVEMENDADAREAIERINNTAIDGRTVTVAEAHPRSEGDRGDRGDRGSSGDRGGSSRW
jgi:cold-inducible RNA-binding protein